MNIGGRGSPTNAWVTNQQRAGSPTGPCQADEPDELGLTNAYWKLNAQYLIEQLIDGKTEYTKVAREREDADALPSLVVRTSSKQHEMLYQQILHTLATSLREAPADTGAVRLVPLSSQCPKSRSFCRRAVGQSASTSSNHPAFEMEHPGHSDVLKQAMEMRALVVVADVRELVEMGGFGGALRARAQSPTRHMLYAAVSSGRASRR